MSTKALGGGHELKKVEKYLVRLTKPRFTSWALERPLSPVADGQCYLSNPLARRKGKELWVYK